MPASPSWPTARRPRRDGPVVMAPPVWTVRLTFAIGAAAGCALAAFGLAASAGEDDRAGLPDAASIASAAPLQADAAGGEAEIGAILARPLFDPNRHGSARIAAAGPAALPRLSGTLITRSARLAIFAVSEADQPVSVPEGGRIGAFLVQSITLGHAVLTGPDGAHILQTAFSAANPPQPQEAPK